MGSLIGSRFLDQYAYQINGTAGQNAYVDNPSFKADTQGMFFGWVWLETLFPSNNNKGIIGYGAKDAGSNVFLSFRQVRTAATANQNRFQQFARTVHAGALNTNNGGTSLVAGAWYSVAWGSDGATTYLTTNNVAQTLSGTNNGNWYGDIPGADHRLILGSEFAANALSGNPFDGRYNELCYANRILTAGELTAFYNAGVPRNPHRLGLGSALKSWWRFGDSRDTSGIIYDEIGTNNLTVVGGSYVTP